MKTVSVLLGVALVLVSGAALHLWREADSGRQQIEALRAQLRARGESSVASAPVSTTPPAMATADPAPAGPTAADPAQAAAASRPADTAVSNLLETMRANQSSPEAMARSRQTMRMVMASSHPDIGEALGLSPDEAEKLLDLLAEQQAIRSQVFSSNTGDAAMTPQERSAALQQRQQAHEAELQAMLGSKYPQWQDYSQTQVAWQQRRDLRAVLEAAGTPLTDAQGKSLVAALAAENRRINEERRHAATVAAGQAASGADILFSRYTPEGRQRLLDAAAPHLLPQQLEGFRGMLDRAAAQEQSMRATLQSAAEAARQGR